MTAPKRVQRTRTKGGGMPPGSVYVGRPGKWGNPYTLDLYTDVYPDSNTAGLREMAVSDFRGLIEGRWDRLEDVPAYPDAATIRAELAGKDLACWCPLDGGACHADVLIELANAPI